MTRPTGRPNGRPPGRKNRSTLERDTVVEQVVAGVKNGDIPLKDAKIELNKAMAIAEGVLAKLRPEKMQNVNGLLSMIGGDFDGFTKWYRLWLDSIEIMMRYQYPQLKAIEKPTEAPKTDEDAVIRFGLRVFESGRPVTHLEPLNGWDDDDEDDGESDR